MRRSARALGLCLLMVGAVLPARPAAAQDAAALFQPFSGTAEIRYTRLPRYDLPNGAISYAGTYDLLLHFAVRDPQHFRIDTETVTPALESGLRTIVVRDHSILAYDTRTETAIRSTFTLPREPLPAVFRVSLLSLLLTVNASTFGGPLPAGIGARAYIRQVRRLLRLRYPPQYPPGYARITGRATIAGHPVKVAQFGPLDITDRITGCSFGHPGHCVHHYQRTGSERVWIDGLHHFILQSRTYTPSNPHAFILQGPASFEVTAIRYGIGPTASALGFVPPVPVRRVRIPGFLFGGSNSSGSGLHRIPAPFVDFPEPTQLPVDEGYSSYGAGLSGETTGVDLLYSDGRHAAANLAPANFPIGTRYVSGSYLYVQERRQVHGLPATVRMGTPVTAGICTVWNGTDATGQRWAAFARGAASILILTNALTGKQLLAYIAHSACAAGVAPPGS